MANGYSGRQSEADAMGNAWELRAQNNRDARDAEERGQGGSDEAAATLQDTRERWARGEASNDELAEATRRNRLFNAEAS